MADNILTETDYRSINVGLGMIARQREQLERAARVGLPMDEPLAVLAALEYQLTALKKEFFADKP